MPYTATHSNRGLPNGLIQQHRANGYDTTFRGKAAPRILTDTTVDDAIIDVDAIVPPPVQRGAPIGSSLHQAMIDAAVRAALVAAPIQIAPVSESPEVCIAADLATSPDKGPLNTRAHIASIIRPFHNVPTVVEVQMLRNLLNEEIITASLHPKPPPFDASELLWGGYWDQFLWGVCKQFIEQGVLPGNDTSTTKEGLNRDLLGYSRKILVIAGEDKSSADDFVEAVNNLQKKNKGWDCFQHGALQYILCYATGAEYMISDKFSVARYDDCMAAFKTFLNVLQWVESIGRLDLPVLVTQLENKLYNHMNNHHFSQRGYVTKVIPIENKKQWNQLKAVYTMHGLCNTVMWAFPLE
ncbi:hypothetical protein PROFUN_14844 [Planoprotostelium fungivorum]|uniref:Uncharacterized protein n=1 Tax=Planoprotostelium fungivorum TaxID=1890364 RepID=A0A2P6MYL7_9EUKA|nr:hypothetical protein PROFUN_14844 [Planoprotostelium fungivorum]